MIERFLFWSCPFGVLWASWISLGTSSSRVGKFENISFLNSFGMKFLSLYAHNFGLFIMSQRPCMFYSHTLTFIILYSEASSRWASTWPALFTFHLHLSSVFPLHVSLSNSTFHILNGLSYSMLIFVLSWWISMSSLSWWIDCFVTLLNCVSEVSCESSSWENYCGIGNFWRRSVVLVFHIIPGVVLRPSIFVIPKFRLPFCF